MSYGVLIVEDHNLLRRGLRSIVTGLPGFEVVGEARDGKEAIRVAISLKPHLILMDLSMPGMNGTDATFQIKQRMPNVRILILSVSDSEEYVREALRAGADGYALKDATYEEFGIAIQTVACGKRFLSPAVSIHLVDTYLNAGKRTSSGGNREALTARERSILKLVAEGRTNRMAGEFLNISAKTVEKHRANLMRKLGLANSTELVLVALDMGLIEKRTRPDMGLIEKRMRPVEMPPYLPDKNTLDALVL
jgi:DNA-binding NarL/FixJ family response regulator